MIGLIWTRGSHGAAPPPPVCPAAPYDPAVLPLSLWLEGRNCPGAGVDWNSRASAGTSGNIHTSFHTGGGPQSLAKPLAVSPCGLETAQFLTSPNTVLKISDDPVNPVAPATAIYAGKFIASADPGFGVPYVAGILNDFSNGWKLQFTPSGAAQVFVTTASGGQAATTVNTVAAGAWYVVTVEFTASGVRVRLNRGAWATTANAWAPGTRGTMYVGFDPIFGAQLDTWLGVAAVSNTPLGTGDVTAFEAYCEWYLGTTV